jgi:hypothetical protein
MKYGVLFSAILFCAHLALGQEVFVKTNEAIGGYDPVSYFKESRPVKGNDQFSYVWKNATWKFSTAENMRSFMAIPENYAPQFGGYCAYGMSENHKAPTSPDAWTIVNGKLYLNYNMDVKSMWSKNQQELIEKANKNWPTVKLEKN